MSVPDREERLRPWWASADPDVDRLDPDEDPLDAVRSARRRAAEPSGPRSRAGGSEDRHRDVEAADGQAISGADHDRAAPREDTEADGVKASDAANASEGSEASDAAEVCGVCPVCTGWRYLRDHHPDVAAHLAAAGRHLSDAQPEVVEHLAAAGRHLAAAFRQVIEDRGETESADGTSSESPPRPSSRARSRQASADRFERIDLDDGQGQV